MIALASGKKGSCQRGSRDFAGPEIPESSLEFPHKTSPIQPHPAQQAVVRNLESEASAKNPARPEKSWSQQGQVLQTVVFTWVHSCPAVQQNVTSVCLYSISL